MNEKQLRAAFKRERILYPGDPTPVVQIEMVDRDRVSQRLLWMEGRGYDFRAIAEGNQEPRNPGPDNPLTWPDGFADQLIRELRRTDPSAKVLEGNAGATVTIAGPNAIVIEAEDDATAAELRSAFERALTTLLDQVRHRVRPRKRTQPSHFRLERAVFFMWRHGTARPGQHKTWDEIADEWSHLTADWDESLRDRPREWPDTLGFVPQALGAYDEWRDLDRPSVETFEESLVRQAVMKSLRPLVTPKPGA